MKALVIGLGSMGKRRIRLIKQRYPEILITGIDSRLDRRTEAERLFKIKSCAALDEAIRDETFDVAFVCTAPSTHYDLIYTCLDCRISVFSEINLINANHRALIRLAEERKCKLFLSSSPMYRKEIQYIIEKMQSTSSKINYIYHVGQYLPDWHPWEKYTEFFVGNKETNGCREIFAIEMPWIIEAFGSVKSYKVVSGRFTKLSIDYDDSYIVIIEHESGNQGVLCFDIVSKPAVRGLSVYGESLRIEWNGSPDGLRIYDEKNKAFENIFLYDEVEKDPNYQGSIIENMYADEIDNFFDVIQHDADAKYSFEKEMYVLDLINKIEGIA